MSEQRPIRTAVVTGGHPFDVPAFHAVFRSFPDVDFYPQHLEDFTSDAGKARWDYDVVVFYNMTKLKPGDALQWYEGKTFEALEQIGSRAQGIFVLHHGLLAFPGWRKWSEVVGIENRKNESYHFGQEIAVRVVDREHPITREMTDFVLHDETYVMAAAQESAGNHLLLATDHPRSTPTLAWTRTVGEARVVCYQSGHDAQAFGNTNFRAFVHRSIQWLAGRIG